MKPYQNRNGNSIVKSYQIYGDGIKIEFTDDTVLVYLYEKAGKETVDKMKSLAEKGKGLGTFIGGQTVKGLGEKPTP